MYELTKIEEYYYSAQMRKQCGWLRRNKKASFFIVTVSFWQPFDETVCMSRLVSFLNLDFLDEEKSTAFFFFRMQFYEWEPRVV